MKHALLLLLPLVVFSVGGCKSRGEDSVAPSDDASATESDANARFEDVEWLLVEVGGKPALPGMGTRKPSVKFVRESASVSGNSGVNGFFGPYALDGANLRIEDLAMTRMASTPELMAQESAFAAALGAARSWRIRASALELLDAQGVSVARFTAMR